MDIIDLIETQLIELGIEKGDTVLVHSSLKSLGGGVIPSQILAAFSAALGREGTLVLPSLSYMYCNKNNPDFDYYNTPSNVGIIAETFRTGTKNVVRSLCATHSCCASGAKADYITSGHILDSTPCGPNSPFKRVMELGGKILFLGCGMHPNTSMHAIEELFEPDYLFGEYIDYRMKDKEGNSFIHAFRSHNFTGVAQRYDRIEGLLTEGSEMKKGNVLQAFCHLIDAKAMWEKAGNTYSSNQHYFIDIID
ncbi:MAG: hypothetical protein A2Y15_06010 [Clostridiales bacterium GWF2_36_10]|nr:MAG: hypothetical protein A2Y15_06010 [Clostridiales bacterium GWF2_36_10]HAN20527.1 AAC(3) family N-acetyltransferase [Clostridiales bacterium]